MAYLGKLDYQQLSDANIAAVLAFTLSQLDLVSGGKKTDVEAMMTILEFSIETVAEGSIETGLMYASSVFWRHELGDILILGYDYREINRAGPFFNNSGFDSPFADTTGNQVTHFISEAHLTAAITAYPSHYLFSMLIDNPVGHGIALVQEVSQWIDPNDAGGRFRNDNFETDLRVGGEAAIFVSSLRTAFTPERRATVYQETLSRLMGSAK